MASLLEEKSKAVGIPLKEWIQQAIKSVDAIAINNEAFISTFGNDTSTWPEDIRHSLAITSNPYIFAALKVAHSLAEQLPKGKIVKHKGWPFCIASKSSNIFIGETVK